jgi:hypothetical protein
MRAWLPGSLVVVVVAASGLLVAACVKGDGCDFGLCPGDVSTEDGGDGGVTDGAVAAPPGCDEKAEPREAPKCVVSSYAVFVDAANGWATNPGTRESPVNSITAALGKLGGKSRVYICEGTYPEHVKLTSSVSLYGGFACGTWGPSEKKAKIAPADAGYALEVNGGAGTVADVELVAQPGTSTVLSSIAAFVVSSSQLTLRRVKIQAGAGFHGDDGASATTGTANPASLDGNVGNATTGGPAKTCSCSTGGSSKGGKGGDTGAVEPNGTNGETAYVPPSSLTATGAGGTRSGCEGGPGANNGVQGSDAPPAGDAPSPGLGTLAATGWRPGEGTSGSNAAPGQGGGGGGSYAKGAPAQNGGGGSGACGGCGGGGGGGGKAGGASVALVVFQSTVILEASELLTANAGNGGAGKPGADGAAGGIGGNRGNNACVGGAGGNGGKGGAGSGGAGGISVGVLYKGPKPTLDATPVTTGDKGTPGVGGAGNDGPYGQKAETLEVQ